MFDFSFYELMVFGIIALIVLGPEKLPQAVRTAGTYYAKFRRTASTLKAEMEAELDLAETRQQLQKELEMIRQAEAEMQKEMAQIRGNMETFKKQQHSELNEIEDSFTKMGTVDTDHSTIQTNPTIVPVNISKSQKNSRQLDSEQLNNTEASPTAPHTLSRIESDYLPSVAVTRPWENMWFLLGDYDKKRRLPPAPLLPDYKATSLMNVGHSPASHADKKLLPSNPKVAS